jgi:hypothetical protein
MGVSCRYLKLHGAAHALSSAHAAAAWTKPRLQRKILSRRWRGAEQETGSLRDRRLGIRVVSIGRCWLLVGLHNGLPTTCSIPATFLSPLKQVLVLFPILYLFSAFAVFCAQETVQKTKILNSLQASEGQAATLQHRKHHS